MLRLRYKSVILFLIFSLSITASAQTKNPIAVGPLYGVNGVILIAAGFDPGETNTVYDFMELYDAEIVIVGPTETVLGELGSSKETDFLIDDFTNISDYDFLFVPGGESPSNLIEIPAALELVVDAYNAGLVLAAICHGPWVFAEADIISGRNISGNIGIQSYIVDAGANYISTGIVIDGPFVTADVPYMYDFAQQGILKGLGLFESNPPEVLECSLEFITTGTYGSVSIEVTVTDEFDTKSVVAKLYRFDTEEQEYIISRQVQLSRNENNTIYSKIIELFSYGNYTLWLEVEDVLGNSGVYEDVEKFILENTNSAGVPQFCLLCITVISLLVLIPFRKRMK